MKKRVLSMLMTLALCLTLLPAPAWAAEADAPEGGAPAVSEQVGTNEEENGSEGDPQNTATPDAGSTEDSKADAPESGEDENAGNNADAAVFAVQTMIDALPTVSELEDMDAQGLDAAYNDIQAAYDAYEALAAEQQAQITGADCFKALLGWFSSPTAPLADAQSGEHTHCVCGKDHREIGNHKGATEKTFAEWTSTDSLPTSGAYYLTQNVTISGNVTLTGDVTLCLNGHTVTVSGIDIKDGGTMTLTDCADQQGTIQGSEGAVTGVLILGSKDSSTASFVMYGGKITGFKNAVIAKDYSGFTMYGGSITGNSTNSAAAVSGLTTGTTMSDNKSIITMYGGEISNNTGETGGGVYVGQNCTFTLEGGTISGNTASGHKNQNPTISGQYAVDGGGGVYLDSFGKFNMTGGEISGNTATGNGGGVCVMTYAVWYSASITGGRITENTASGGTACGGGIYGGPAKLTIQNTEISGNKCAGSGGGIFATKPLTLTDVQVINNIANTAGGGEGGGVKLGGDDKDFKDEKALTVSGKTSISDNSPNNYYVDRSCLLPIKVSGALDENARIGICMNPAYDTDSKFLPTDGKDSVVATAEDGVTLRAVNFFPDSYNSDYVVRDDTADGVKFGLCEHEVSEGSNECSKCGTTFVAVLEPTEASAKKGYFRDLSNGARFDNMTGTLKLLQDVTLSGINMWGGTPTLDLNGYTINKGGWFNLYESAALTVIDSSGKPTADRTLDVYFKVNQNCTLNLYDGKNEQGFRGTVTFVELQKTGTLVSCGGKIEKLDLWSSDDNYNVRLWQSNTQYCTVGVIRCVTQSKTIKVSEFLKKNHPGAMLYGTKSDGTEEQIPGSTTINKDGVAGGTYKNLHLQTCEKHEPTSETDLKCKYCGAALVVKISAVKDGTEQVGYFPRDSKDSVTWSSGYAEAAAQLTKWVAEGCTDAKLFPLNDNAYSIPVTCKMTLVGTGHKYINVTVKDGADVLLEGGEYEYITVDGGKATIPAVKCKKVTVNGGKVTLHNECVTGGVKITGGEAIFESGTYDDTFEMNGGTVTVKDGVTFTKNYNLAFQVEKGTLNVEGGTITGGVTIGDPVNLTISGGTFKQAVTITRYDDTNTGTCSISGGTFKDKLTLYRSKSKLSALLADGYAYYQDDTIVSGEATELMNVTVKSDGHTHSFDATTGKCDGCGRQMAASVTVGNGGPTYYATIGAAVTALNAADGAKTLKLFQDINNSSEIYTLTNGPVTLDLNGQEHWGATFIAQGITLTLKSEKTGGYVGTVQTVGKGSKIIANSTNIKNDGNLTVREISAKGGGRLELSAGTFLDLYVVNDGSSASLSGGTYQPLSYDYGKGPDKNTEYAGAYDLLAKGYGYQIKQADSSFAWVTSNSGISSTFRDTYKVVEIGASFEKIYPDDKTDFTGDTYLVKLGEDQTTYTLKLTAVGTPTDRVSYQWQSGSSDGVWTNRPQAGDSNYEVDATKGTITIKNLNPGTYRYKVKYTLKDTTGAEALTGYSAPLTVVVTKHEHSWAYSAEGATITAKCTAEGCYLTDGNGGSVTINAPAADTLTYNGNQKAATVTSSDDWKGVAIDTIAVAYAQNGTALKSAPTEVGTYTASITLTNGDGSKATASVEYTIAQAELTIDSVTVASKTYNGSADAEITNVTFTGLKNSEALTKGTDYEVSGTFNSANVNEANKVTGTVTLKDTSKVKNYKLPITTYDVSATIAQAATPAAPTGLTGVKDQLLSTVSLAAHPGWSWADGAVSMSTAGSQNFNANYHDSNGNYADGTNVPVRVNVVNKTDTGVTITGLPQTVTYGDAFTLEAAQTGDTGTSGKWSWDFDGDYFQEKSTGGHQGTLTLQAIKAGTPSKGITATYESGTHKGSATVNPSVTQKEVTVTAGSYKVSKTYDGTTNAGTATGELNVTGILSADSGVTVKVTPVAYTSANVGGQTSMNVSIALDGTGKDNYKIKNGATTVSVPCEVTKAMLTVEGTGTASGTYGDKLSGLTVSGLTAKRNGTVVPGTWSLTGNTVPNVGDNGTYTATFTPESGVDNYDALTKDGVTLNITKAAYGNQSVSGSAKYGTTGSVDLSRYLAAGGSFGTITTADSEKVLSGDPVMEGNSLKFTFVNDASKANKMATITVPVTGATNYESYTITVTVTVNDKTTPVVTAPTAKTRLVYNGADQVLIDAGSATGGTLQYSLASGSGYSTELPKVKNAGTYTVYYKVIGNDGYADVPENSVSVSVAKRTISVKADNKSMTENGTLPTFTVSYGNFASGDSEATVIETKATASCAATGTSTGSFTITVSGTTTLKSGMDTNYEVGTPESGTLTVNPRSSSGGGGGGSVSTYSVTVGKTENGSVSVSPKSASKGDTVTITVTPDKGYVLETLTVLDKNDKEIKLTEKNGKYTFTMPAGKVEVKVTFMDDNTMLNYFVDVKAGDYFYDAVLWAAEKGITSGTDATHFSPNAACTRAQIVTFLWRAAGSPEPKGTGSFADVPADSYYTKAVAWAVENGITGGTGDGKFSPDATCTRAQAVTFLYRASGASAVSGNAAFSDVATNAYYAAAVKWAEKNGVTGGIGGGLFGSGNDCTRAQIVTFLYRSYQSK